MNHYYYYHEIIPFTDCGLTFSSDYSIMKFKLTHIFFIMGPRMF